MNIHILGICGTFMAGLALLARRLGFEVTGSDAKAYPPMSTQLEAEGVVVCEGYSPEHLEPAPDCVIIGNALSRGNPAVEHVLNEKLRYVSGPAWLAEHVLCRYHVMAVAGTHGKTTASSALAWILSSAGHDVGFLIGGIPLNFGVSARLGDAGTGDALFVLEADEYDSAFFDKRSKFVHYRPSTLLLNNLEFDHADIFDDLAAIKRQFHHLVRTVPGRGTIVSNADDQNLTDVLEQGCWTPIVDFGMGGGEWRVKLTRADAGAFDVWHGARVVAQVEWNLLGAHNAMNALGAIASAACAGVSPARASAALADFRSVKRRLEVRGVVSGVTVYDDFAHHPSAIAATLTALRRATGSARILALLDPASNSMRMGVHKHTLGPALKAADRVWLYQPRNAAWPLQTAADTPGVDATVETDIDAIVRAVVEFAQSGDHIVIMSNGAFGGLHDSLIGALERL